MSNFEDELAERLRARASSVSVPPDLADLEARAALRRGRGRSVAAVGVAAVVALGLAGIVAVQSRDDGSDPSADVASPAPPGTGDTDGDESADPTAPAETGAPSDTGDGPTTEVPATELPSGTNEPVPIDEPTAPAVIAGPTNTVPGIDPAEQYLPRTREIYRRELGDGRAVVARLSDETYASLFDIAWNAPTGSADECLGDRGLLLGMPGEVGFWGSAWTAQPWFDDFSTDQPVVIVSSAPEPQPDKGGSMYHLLRASPGVAEIVLVAPGGVETDRVEVIDGFAVVREPSLDGLVDPEDAQSPQLRLYDVDGVELDPVLLWDAYGSHETPLQCTPGDPPTPELPPPGEQPDDPDVAEAQIRARHALLVDRSVAADDKPDDLLDDDTGIQDAVAEVDTGQFSESAAEATYEIEKVVFTAPDEAWFRYTITAPTGVFAGRFGIARYNGDVWQITRGTICQDLALAQGECKPPAESVGTPPQSPEWEAASREWEKQAEAYWGGDCPPLSGC